MMPVRIALLSCAHVHAGGWVAALKQIPEARLTAIYDDDLERARRIAGPAEVVITSDLEAALAQCEAVMIASENARHWELTLASARSGKHVLCEKPLAVHQQHGLQMIEACEAAGVILMPAFPCRFYAPVQRARQLISEGKIGRILAIKGTNHGYLPSGWFADPILAGGGAVMDHTVHVVDLMRWFIGDEVSHVYAEIGTLFHDVRVDDAGVLSLEFSRGVFATLDASWSRGSGYYTWGDVTMEIIGTSGTLWLDAYAQHIDFYDHEKSRHRIMPWGDTGSVPLLREFVWAIIEARTPAVTGLDGLRATEVALAAYQSARTGEMVRVGWGVPASKQGR